MAKQHKIGTVIVFNNANVLADITNGKEYVISGIDQDGDEYFIDDAGDEDYAAATGHTDGIPGDGIYTVVTK